MDWIGLSSPFGFEVRGRGVAVRVSARGTVVERGEEGERSHSLLLLALLPALLLVALEVRGAREVVGLLSAVFLAPFALRFGQFRRWHGAEHKVVEALLLTEEGLPPEEAWRRASFLSPRCGTVALGLALFLAPFLYLIHPWALLAAIPLALALHLKLPADSPIRALGLLLERLVVTEPGPLEETRALEAFLVLRGVLTESR